MSFRKRLNEILYDLSAHQIKGTKDGFVTDFKVEESMDLVLQAIREELVPKEKLPQFTSGIPSVMFSFNEWNSCRNEILERIEKV